MIQYRLGYKCRFMDVYWNVVNAVACFYLFIFIPKQFFIKQVCRELVKKHLLPNGQQIVYYKSGRAALRGLLETLKSINPEYKIIFLPDYICNVVYQAAETAGFSIQSYKTDDTFSPIWRELIPSVRDKSHPVILLASMFGRVNSCQKNINIIFESNPEAFIVADECQHLVTNSTIGCAKNMAVIFSFNKKTIPGLMGGGVCVNGALSKLIKPIKLTKLKSVKVNARLFIHAIKELLIYIHLYIGKPMFSDIDTPIYDYSVGGNILYDTSPQEIAKLSVIRAWVCLRQLKNIERLRQKNYKAILTSMKEMLLCPNLPEQMRAAYIPIQKKSLKRIFFQFVFIKRPYAIHKRPESAEKEIYCLMNSIPLRWVNE